MFAGPKKTNKLLGNICIKKWARIAQNATTHPGLLCVLRANFKLIKDVRQTNKRESGPKPATSAHAGRLLGSTALVFNELAYGFCREDLNEANEIFSRILLVV